MFNLSEITNPLGKFCRKLGLNFFENLKIKAKYLRSVKHYK